MAQLTDEEFKNGVKDAVEKLLRAAELRERQACARIAQEKASEWAGKGVAHAVQAACEIAEAIGSRK